MPFIVLDPAAAQAAPASTLGEPLTNEGVTLEELRSELDLLLLGRTDVDSDRIDRWINEAYLDIYTSIEWEPYSLELTLTADQPLYLLPDAVEQVIGAALQLPEADNVNGGYPLDRTTRDYYRSLALETDDPRMFFVIRNMLVLYPTPSEERTLVLDVAIRPLELTVASDSPIVPREFHEAIKAGARRRAHDAIHEYDRAAIAGNQETDIIRKRKDPMAMADLGRVVRSSAPYKHGIHRNVTRHYSDDDEN